MGYYDVERLDPRVVQMTAKTSNSKVEVPVVTVTLSATVREGDGTRQIEVVASSDSSYTAGDGYNQAYRKAVERLHQLIREPEPEDEEVVSG